MFPSIHLSIYLSIYLYLPCVFAYLSIDLSIYLRTLCRAQVTKHGGIRSHLNCYIHNGFPGLIPSYLQAHTMLPSGTLFWDLDLTAMKLGILQKGYGMSQQVYGYLDHSRLEVGAGEVKPGWRQQGCPPQEDVHSSKQCRKGWPQRPGQLSMPELRNVP